MNKHYSIFIVISCLLIGVGIICSSCRKETVRSLKDVSDQPQYLKGLKPDAEYVLRADAFYRVYEGKASLHGPNSLWCDFSVSDFQSGMVTNQYVKGIITKGTTIQFKKAVVNDLSTHTVILYYAIVQAGKYQGQEVLINSLVDDLPTWLSESPSD